MYGRDYLKKAIPAATAETVDPTGNAPVAESEEFAKGFNEVLDVLRAEYLHGKDPLESREIDDACALGCEAWDEYCSQDGDVPKTLIWLRNKLA